ELDKGGSQAWCTVAGAWLALFATFGYISSFGVYQDFFTRSGTASSSNVSWIGSTQLFFFAAMGPPTGKLLDKGYFRQTVLAGSIIYTFSLFMLSLAHIDKYYQIFLSQGIGMGIGAGLIYLPSLAVQAHYWRTRRALAMGVAITGSSVGGIVYPIMLNQWFHGSVGFNWGVRGSAFLTMGVLVVANYLMRPQYSDNNQKTDEDHHTTTNLRDILTDWPFVFLVLIGGSFVLMGLFFAYFYLQLFTIDHGLDPNFAFYTLTIQNGASIFGRTIPNLFADRYGVLNAMIVVIFGTMVMVFTLFGIHDVGGVVVFAILYGFFSGGVLSLIAPAIVSFVRHPKELGVRLGLAYLVSSFAYLIGPPVIGALLTNGTQWSKPIIFSGACTFY
ncbi:MFS general substrate transporter, partial [Hysterangium stoloniferum]